MQYRSIIAGSMLAGVAFAQTGQLGDAEAHLDNPVGATYVAVFEGESVNGIITAVSTTGEGVDFTVDIKITPEEGKTGAYGYHIHDQPVPASGNCTETLAHLDPYKRGAETPCDKANPETCEVGDLAGKHGKAGVADSAEPVNFAAQYNDLYATTKEGLGAFIGNRSIVVHASDKSRIACANFQLVTGPDVPTYGPSGGASSSIYEPSASSVYVPAASSTPCATSLITKTYASTESNYGSSTVVYHTSVETSISYSVVVPEPSAPVYPGHPSASGYPSGPVYPTGVKPPTYPPAGPTAVYPPGYPPAGPYPTGAVPSGVPVPPTNGTVYVPPAGSAPPSVPVPPTVPVPETPAGNVPEAPATSGEAPPTDSYTGGAATFGVSAGAALFALAAFFL